MDKRLCVRGIILNDNSIYLIHRIKPDREYYTLPGGGIEENESLEDALHREIIEELGIKVNIIKELYKYETDDRIETFVLCSYLSGSFKDANGPEWNSEEYKSHGKYGQELVNLNNLDKYNIMPPTIKDELLKDLLIDSSLKSIEYKEFKI